MRSVELFTGAGGLAMGFAKAGFRHEAVVERDKNACATIRDNQRRSMSLVRDWRVFHMNVADFDFSSVPAGLDVLAGGPPCQPFSLGGKHRGHHDERDMFPQVVRAVRLLQPRAIVIENVKGLLRSSFAGYFEYILLQLSHPEITRRDDESWSDHLGRLECHHTGGAYDGLRYHMVFRVLNAADYGVPQRRERVFLVGFRNDVGAEWSFPEPTHSQDALLWSQGVTGEYWERHAVGEEERQRMPSGLEARVATIKSRLFPPDCQPWLTVRDAIADLPHPSDRARSCVVMNHQLNPGARVYPGHTGSQLDEPAKTLKAGDHGVPGGENMLAYHDGMVRYLTVRECARLQTFPDDYVFSGSWTETMRQLGNAVPVRLAEMVAHSVRKKLQPTLEIEAECETGAALQSAG